MEKNVDLVSPGHQRVDYVRFVHNKSLPSLHVFYRRKKLPAVLGTNKFIHFVKKNYNPPLTTTARLMNAKLKHAVDLPQIEQIVRSSLAVIDDKSQTSKQIRDGVIYLARSICGKSYAFSST